MAQGQRQYDLVLLGATGYTGKLTAEWISNKLPSDLRWAIAGRNAKKLQAVVDDLTELHPNRKQPTIETCELQKEQLVTLAQKTRLMITTVGPFMTHGEPVLAACAESGTHYLDSTGEVPWYLEMVEKYHETAQRTGALIIPQCGLDSVPADIMTFVLVKYIREEFNAPTLSAVYTLYDGKMGVSGGTASTILNLFEHYPLTQLAKSMKPYSLSPVPASRPARAPTSGFPYSLFGLKNIRELGGVQTEWLMAGADACLVHRSWGLYESAARGSSKPEVSYGPRFRFTEYQRAKSFTAGALVKLSFVIGGMLMMFPFSRWILTPLIKKFLIPAPGEGPSKEERRKEFFVYRSLGVADTDRKEKVVGRLELAHGGYEATGLTLSAAADVILRGDINATQARRLGGGIVTPATLGEQYVEKLKEFGMKVEVGTQ